MVYTCARTIMTIFQCLVGIGTFLAVAHRSGLCRPSRDSNIRILPWTVCKSAWTESDEMNMPSSGTTDHAGSLRRCVYIMIRLVFVSSLGFKFQAADRLAGDQFREPDVDYWVRESR